MTEQVQYLQMRSATLVTPAVAAPTAVAGPLDSRGVPTVPSGAGVYVVASDVLNTNLAAASGVPSSVRIVPYAKDGNTTWTLSVYGYFIDTSDRVWRPILLFSGSCVCDVALTGDQGTLLDNNDKSASAITAAGTYPAAMVAVWPSHVRVETSGCPFLYFQTSESDPAAGRVAVAPVC